LLFVFHDLAPVVQKVDSAIQWISIRETNWVIHWMEIYPVDSTIHLLNNWGLTYTGFGHLKKIDPPKFGHMQEINKDLPLPPLKKKNQFLFFSGTLKFAKSIQVKKYKVKVYYCCE